MRHEHRAPPVPSTGTTPSACSSAAQLGLAASAADGLPVLTSCHGSIGGHRCRLCRCRSCGACQCGLLHALRESLYA